MKTLSLVLLITLAVGCASRPVPVLQDTAAALPPAEAVSALPAPELSPVQPEPPREAPARPTVAAETPATAVTPSRSIEPLPVPGSGPSAPAPTEIARAVPLPLPEPRQEPPMTDERLQKLIALAEVNDERLLEVFVGMYRGTVQSIMGFSRQNPYKREVITGIDGAQYEVLFYLTREPRRGRGVTERQLTPVIFRDDRVIAIGRYPLMKLRRTGMVGKVKLPPAEPPRMP